jgi:protein SCO1/2
MFEKIVEHFKQRPYFWSAVVAMIFITVLTPLTRRVPAPPPVISTVPAFTLTGPNGSPFGSTELKNKVYVASFIFTRCQSVCPLIVQHLGELQQRILFSRLPLTLVSLTVDPEHDTPSVLKSFAEKVGADPATWTFLTGSRDDLVAVVEQGFTVGVGAPTLTNGLMDIAHSQKLILVDGQSRIRGFYNASSEGVDEIFSRAEAVVGESML